MVTVTHCARCGDYLFNGHHHGNVERWCRKLRETISTEPARETISRPRRGRPRKGDSRETISRAKPWATAGISRASWYRRRKIFPGQ
jgi:hypothetical protein